MMQVNRSAGFNQQQQTQQQSSQVNNQNNQKSQIHCWSICQPHFFAVTEAEPRYHGCATEF